MGDYIDSDDSKKLALSYIDNIDTKEQDSIIIDQAIEILQKIIP